MLERYRDIAPAGVLDDLQVLAAGLKGKSLQHINSTRAGGGVAELLSGLVAWTNELGIETRWDVLEGTLPFFEVTKAIHNALQGEEIELSSAQRATYLECVADNAQRLKPSGDVIMVHDPQPAYLIQHWRSARDRMIWRCHIDLSRPNEQVWRFLLTAIERYPLALFHVPEFAQKLPMPQLLAPPSIDPLSEKNRDLERAEVDATVSKFGIDPRRPIVLQVSRFDRFKDPLGVINTFRMVRKNFDCQLVLAGGSADDDPEGAEVLSEAQSAAGADPDIFVLALPPDSHLAINALQRAATIVVQKSLREGFGLTVTEAMWKGKPVVAGAVGGIPSQISQGVTGFLVHSSEGAAFRLRFLLSHPKAAERMGEAGREHVRRNFLITRHVRDHLLLMHLLLRGVPESPISLEQTWEQQRQVHRSPEL